MTKELANKESASEAPTEIDRVFRDLHHGFLDAFGFEPFGWSPYREVRDGGLFRAARTDVSDTGKAYRIVAEVPGIPKEKLEIRVRGTNVEIRGEQSTSEEKEEADYVHRERRYSGYYRTLELPEPVVADKAKARVENGLLELELPKLHPSPSNAEVRIAVE